MVFRRNPRSLESQKKKTHLISGKSGCAISSTLLSTVVRTGQQASTLGAGADERVGAGAAPDIFAFFLDFESFFARRWRSLKETVMSLSLSFDEVCLSKEGELSFLCKTICVVFDIGRDGVEAVSVCASATQRERKVLRKKEKMSGSRGGTAAAREIAARESREERKSNQKRAPNQCLRRRFW